MDTIKISWWYHAHNKYNNCAKYTKGVRKPTKKNAKYIKKY